MSLSVPKVSNANYVQKSVSFNGSKLSNISKSIPKKNLLNSGDKLQNAMGLVGWGLLLLGFFGGILFGAKAMIADKKQQKEIQELFHNRAVDSSSTMEYSNISRD